MLFVGYPEGLWDPSSGFPIVRRGVTATSLIDDYRGDPVFLIDGAVYPGCSGGPVVILERELVVTAEGTLFGQRTPQHVTEQDRFAFLGMITDVVRDPSTREPRLNLGVVVKARHVFGVIREYETLTGHSA